MGRLSTFGLGGYRGASSAACPSDVLAAILAVVVYLTISKRDQASGDTVAVEAHT